MLQAYDELARVHPAVNSRVQVLPAGNIERVSAGYDMVYLDPPYVGLEERHNRDDYWRRYHFLEGLASYEQWEELIDRNSKIRVFEPPPWIADWSRKSSFEDRLFSLVETHRSSIVALSYVTGAFPSERRIKSFFESKFKDVSVHSAEHSHALSKSKKRELLFVGRRKK
jgi:adenine-specific DNA-methyltransferase